MSQAIQSFRNQPLRVAPISAAVASAEPGATSSKRCPAPQKIGPSLSGPKTSGANWSACGSAPKEAPLALPPAPGERNLFGVFKAGGQATDEARRALPFASWRNRASEGAS